MDAAITLAGCLAAVGVACWMEARFFQAELANEHGKLELTREAYLDVLSERPAHL